MGKHARGRWRGGLQFEALVDGEHHVPMGGHDDEGGPRPASLLLAALAGCIGMDVISILQKKHQQVSAYQVEVTGEQQDAHPRLFTDITVEHIVHGASIDETAVARSIELSASRYCVVTVHMSQGDTVVHHRYRISDEAGEREGEVLTTGPHGAGLALPVPA